MKQEYKTMREIAEELGVSKQTVFIAVKDHNIKHDSKQGNAFIYNQETTARIKEVLGFKEPLADNNQTNDKEVLEEHNNLTEAQEQLYKDFAKEREAIREDYKEQLKSKDKQIEELHKLLDQQQQLALVNYNKIEALETKVKEEEAKEDKPKKSWNFFKRK